MIHSVSTERYDSKAVTFSKDGKNVTRPFSLNYSARNKYPTYPARKAVKA